MPKIVNKSGVSPALAMALSVENYSKGASDISVTELLQPPRIRQLLSRHGDEIEEDASDLIYRMFGKITHEIIHMIQLTLAGNNTFNRMEAITAVLLDWVKGTTPTADVPNSIKLGIDKADKELIWEKHKRLFEERFFASAGPYILSGAVDDLEVQDPQNGTINDYKVCSIYQAQDEAGKEEWIQQLNMYRWLVWKAKGWDIKTLRVQMIFRDWSKTTAHRDKNYPQAQSKTINLDVWPMDKIESFILDRVKVHSQADSLKENDLPLCTASERWARDQKYAVMKHGRQRAVKLVDTPEEGHSWISSNRKKDEELYLEKREGTSIRCLHYCIVSSICPFGRMLKEKGD